MKGKKVSLAVATLGAAAMTAAASVTTGFLTTAYSEPDIVRVTKPGPTVTVTPPPAPSPTVHLGNLSAGELVDTCYTVRGDSTLSGDQAIAVGTQAAGDRWYWQGGSVWDDSSKRHWHIDLHIGDVSDHRPYSETVTVIVAPTTVVDYLKATNKAYPTETWWSSPTMPPDVLAQDSAVVTRSGHPGESC